MICASYLRVPRGTNGIHNLILGLLLSTYRRGANRVRYVLRSIMMGGTFWVSYFHMWVFIRWAVRRFMTRRQFLNIFKVAKIEYSLTSKRIEKCQSFFDCNAESHPPNGIHNYVNTRSELKCYDSVPVYGFLKEIFPCQNKISWTMWRKGG